MIRETTILLSLAILLAAPLSSTGTESERTVAACKVLTVVGRWKGTSGEGDDQEDYLLGPYSFEADGKVSAELEFPDPIGKQRYYGKYQTLTAGELEVRLDRWGGSSRKFKFAISGDRMTWVDEKGNKFVFQRLR
jgi:hypothetical protein